MRENAIIQLELRDWILDTRKTVVNNHLAASPSAREMFRNVKRLWICVHDQRMIQASRKILPRASYRAQKENRIPESLSIDAE